MFGGGGADRTLTHSRAGAINVNEGTGSQMNSTLSGGWRNQQFHAETINYRGLCYLSNGSKRSLPCGKCTTYSSSAERAEIPPPPCAIIPFRCDQDYVPCAPLIDQIYEKLSAPAGRVALVGLGRVGYGRVFESVQDERLMKM